MLDLDALKPKSIEVRLNGQTYNVPTREGLPLAAHLDALQIQQAPAGAEQVRLMVAFISTYAKLPAVELTQEQIVALMGAIFGTDAAPKGGETDPLRPDVPQHDPAKQAIIDKYRGKVTVP